MLLKGIKVGVLKEGFEDLFTDHNVEVTSRTAEFETEFKRFQHRYIETAAWYGWLPTYGYRDTRLALHSPEVQPMALAGRNMVLMSGFKIRTSALKAISPLVSWKR
jgi:hypothetical protein